LIPTILWLFLTFYLWKWCTCKVISSQNCVRKLVFCWHLEGSGSGSISQRHGCADPDPYPPQNVMDPQQCGQVFKIYLYCWDGIIGMYVRLFSS
jgi:hypothetical protein